MLAGAPAVNSIRAVRPQMDAGDGEMPETIRLSWTPEEVERIRDALNVWLISMPDDPERHLHVVDRFGRALTVDVMEPDDPRFGRSGPEALVAAV